MRKSCFFAARNISTKKRYLGEERIGGELNLPTYTKSFGTIKKIPNLPIIIGTKKGFDILKKLLKISVFRLKFSDFYHTLISTSTPEGSSNFINASTVLEEDE